MQRTKIVSVPAKSSNAASSSEREAGFHDELLGRLRSMIKITASLRSRTAYVGRGIAI
jgi:hypothetical protein